MSQPPQPPDDEGRPAPAGTSGLDAATTHLAARDPEASDADRDGGDERRSEVPDSEHDPSLEGLGSRLRSGAKFASVALIFTQVISLAQTIVVARILSPAEIGTFTLGTIFANFLTTLTDGGMRAALIQRGRQIEDAANTVFWVGLLTGTAMSLTALAAAPLLSMYFDDRLVGLICAATCGTLLIHSLLNVPEALMQRRFNFKRRLIVDPTTASTFALVTVTLSLLGFGVWGMVIGLYASQLATLIACWALAGWRPGKGRFVFRIWREMAGYAGPLIVSSVVDQAREAVQSALVGGRLDVASAGQYRYGRRIAILPGQAIIQVASYVLFPAFARIAADVTRFRDGLLRSLRMLWVATTPFAAVLVALGQPLIVVLLGEQWRPAGLFVAAMAGFGPGVAMAAIGMESIKGAGRSKLINWLTALSIIVGVGGLILLLPFGLVGVGLAASIDSLVGGVVALMLARRLAGVSMGDLARVLVPPLIAAMVAGAVVGYLEHWVLHSDQQPIVLGLVYLTLEGLLLMAIFGGLLYLMAPDAIRELRDGVLRRGGRGGGDDEGDKGADETSDPTGPRPDDLPEFFDAPTEILPIFNFYGPTEQVYSPFRQPLAPRPPAPMRRLEPSPRSVPVRPTTPVGVAERTRRFEDAGLDAPTTAIPPADPTAPGPLPAGSPRRRITATVRPATRVPAGAGRDDESPADANAEIPGTDQAPPAAAEPPDEEPDGGATETMRTHSGPDPGEGSDKPTADSAEDAAGNTAGDDAGEATTRTLSTAAPTESGNDRGANGHSNGTSNGNGSARPRPRGSSKLVSLVEVPGADAEAPGPGTSGDERPDEPGD